MRSLPYWLGNKPLPIELYFTNIVILASIATSDTLSAMCGKCLNNSSCRIITHLESNVSVVQCACLQGWQGEDCQQFVSVRVVTVTLTTVNLKFEVTSPDGLRKQITENISKTQESNGSIGMHENDARHLTKPISVEYWTSSKAGVCNIVPNITVANVSIMGLEPGTRYKFCARTVRSPLCDYSLVKGYENTNAPNCASIITKTDDNSVPLVYVILASGIAASGLIALFIVIFIAKKKGYLSLVFCVKHNKNETNRQNGGYTEEMSHMAQTSETSDHDMLLMKSPRNNDHTISISTPQGPGIPKYQVIHKRLRGYASFSAKNEQTIPLSTVIEYGADDQDYETDDNDDDYPEGQTEVEIHVTAELNDHVDFPGK